MKITLAKLNFVKIEGCSKTTSRINSLLSAWIKDGALESEISKYRCFKVLKYKAKFYAYDQFHLLYALKSLRPEQKLEVIVVKSKSKTQVELEKEVIEAISNAGLSERTDIGAAVLRIKMLNEPITKWAKILGIDRGTLSNRANEKQRYRNKDIDGVNHEALIHQLEQRPDFPSTSNEEG